MHFGEPENLWWLLVLAPMVAGLGFYFWWKRKVVERVGHLPMVQKMSAHSSTGRQVTRGILVIVATALLCVSAARPQWGQDDRTLKRFGVDVVFALDISKSMLAQDVPPSRLDAAREEIRETMTTLTGDRVGLVVFTAVSFAQSPLTTDYGAIRFYLEKLDPNQMPVGGTSVGQAIWDAIDLLVGKESPDEASEESEDAKKADTQIIVLITDGEDHESNPMQMAERAKERGIKIVTVGLGSVDGSKIPLYGPNGRLKGYKRNRKGELVYTKLDDTTLKKIAEVTGGTYVHYTGKNSVVNALDDYIDQLEKREIETMLRERYKDRYMYFLAPALLLLLIALALGERRKTPRGARGSDNEGASTTLMVLLMGSLLFLGGCENAFRDTLDSVERGNAFVEEEKFDQALEAYRNAEEQVPARPELHYDLGIAHLGAEDYENAREAFARALSTRNPQLEFDALFNLGLTLSRQENWKEAHETYKQALRVDLDTSLPENQQRVEQARHNLETVFRRLYPPCAQLEDDFEENDTASAATQLEKLSKEDLALCGLDDDWFAIPAIPGTNVSVDVQFDELRDQPDPDQVFLRQPQDLHVTLFDSGGEEAIAVDQGDPESFDPEATSASRSIAQFEVTDEMMGNREGMLLLKIGAADGLEFSYDLDIEAIPPCRALEDDFEENDTLDTARSIDSGKHKLHHCPGDDDWYAVDLEVGDSFFADFQPQKDAERGTAPKLEARLLRATDGAVVAESQSQGPLVALGIRDVMQPGEYYLHVRGQTDDEQGPYNAQLFTYAPCPAGDDRFEENDDPTEAATLPKKPPLHRYLRICEGDRDFFKVEPNDEGKISWGLRRARIGADTQPKADADPMKLDLLDASGDKMLAAGATPKDTAPDPRPGADANEKQPAMDSAVTLEDADVESALLRVSGPQDFYHLVQMDPQQNQNDKQQDDQDQEQQDDEKQDGDEGDQEEQKDDSDSKSDENEQKDDEKGEESDEKDKESKGDESKDTKPEDAEERKAREKQAQEGQAKKAPEQQRMEDILRALEENDSNFQMRKALEDMPERDIERDW